MPCSLTAKIHPAAIAQLLVETGFGESEPVGCRGSGNAGRTVPPVPRHAGGNHPPHPPSPTRGEGSEFSPLNVVILETRGLGGVLPEFPGIPDEQFSTGAEPGKGLLSKREVRLTILSLLAPRAGEIGWDVGAGCGGVSVEWARWNPYGEVHAVECHPERLEHLGINRERFGVVSNLHIIPGRAPEALADLPDPHAVFIGGSSGSLRDLLDAVWVRLRPGGRLVASAVTEDSRVDLHGFAGDRQADWTELSIARGERLAGQRVMRPYLPVLLMRLEKLGHDRDRHSIRRWRGTRRPGTADPKSRADSAKRPGRRLSSDPARQRSGPRHRRAMAGRPAGNSDCSCPACWIAAR